MLLDRMVNLLSRGCVVPVLRYVKQCWQRGDTDISLIRYFITEVIQVGANHNRLYHINHMGAKLKFYDSSCSRVES